MQIKNNVFIVTGGASGLGEGTARLLAQHGAKVVIADMQDEKGLAIAAELGGVFMHCDVSNEEQAAAVVAKAQTGIREFVVHEREGLLATSDSDMVVQLTRVVADRELRERMTEHNRSTPSPVDWSEVVARNVDAYRLAMTLPQG